MSKFIDQKAIEYNARGQWGNILRALAPNFFCDVLDVRIGTKTTCPGCGRPHGFRFFRDFDETGGGICDGCGARPSGIALLRWACEKDFFEVLKDVASLLGGGEFKVTPAQRALAVAKSEKSTEIEDKAIRGRLTTAYTMSGAACLPPGKLAQRYLLSRGIDPRLLELAPKEMRFHKMMSYLHTDGSRENFPAMLARVRAPDGTPVTLHRTFLDAISGEKANVSEPKKLMSHTSLTSLSGAAIRLAPVSDIMGVTEGIETGYACMQATDLPVWATISAVFMENFIPPEGVKRVVVFADKDRSLTGQNAATKLVENLWSKGIKASIELPTYEIPDKKKGIDWLDVLNEYGVGAFPKVATS